MLTFTGRLGKMSGFRRKGKHYVRSKPESIRQTGNMKRSAYRFGKASSTGAFIRKSLGIMGDGAHVNRITKALIPSGGMDVSKLTGVCFNKAKRTDAYFRASPVLRKNGAIHIPAQRFAQNVPHLEVLLIAVRIDVTTRKLICKKNHRAQHRYSSSVRGCGYSFRSARNRYNAHRIMC